MNQPTNTGTRVRVECERCGVVRLPASQVTLRASVDGAAETVRYRCPRCGLLHVEPVEQELAAALAACDEVGFEAWAGPVETPLRPDAPAFCADDVDEWIELLTDDAALRESVEVLTQLDARREGRE